MPAYNFQGQFVGGILDGSKRQTIRKRRKRATVSGDVLQLYTGLRTKQARLLKVVDCTSVVPVQVVPFAKLVKLDGRALNAAELGLFTQRDGFESVDDFFSFFERYGLDVLFEQLEVIYWR